ncbi:uncharacterized protein BO97DRAFT_406827 [Aspergillus homomorphus CBS 101889]|uniref:LYR family protein n=1 Tax=Aspergillus homomorphus (strain CBS 101889) TaxID=1450537 RepID=A0A395HT77_ASPHC|nr:hypothetical protein BO97DRAFT_406827 [Aspergillus homomorphus CBS 101889]RAL10575.1 hypothetical protein BO97DRAFT_406827 [Aspergillus homomorphus CBS 101889]
MPPTFRSSRSGRQFGDAANRNRTGQIDHDVFEGLPVRRWTRQTQTISQVPKNDVPDSSDVQGSGGKPTIPEHPMPRDSHLLTPMSRALLRAARAGCIYIRQAAKDSEDDDKEATDGEEQPLIQSTERSFVARKWTAVPKHLEAVEVEFLAKRRPGMQSLYGASATDGDGSNSGPMRRTRFKKVDPVTGNISIYEAWVPEGHKIEGEISDETQVAAPSSAVTVTPEAPAPGTVIEGVGVVNAEGVVVAEAGSENVMTPPRRRPPPPKRKAKGVGKGRRKKVMFAPGDGADASQVHGAGGVDSAADKEDDTDPSRLSVGQAGQDEEEDEGDEVDESDDGDESMLDAKTPETSAPPTSTELSAAPEPVPVPALEALQPQPLISDNASVATSKTPSEHPAPPSAPSEPPEVSRDPSKLAPVGKPSATPGLSKDVEMADAVPSEPTNQPAPQQGPDSQQQTPQESAKAAFLSPSQDTLRAQVLETPSPTANMEAVEPLGGAGGTVTQPSSEQLQHGGDIVMEGSTDLPGDASKLSSNQLTPEPSTNHRVGSQPSEESTETKKSDLLGTLEASLDNPPQVVQPSEQANEVKMESVDRPAVPEPAAETIPQTISAAEITTTQTTDEPTGSGLERSVEQPAAFEHDGQTIQPPSEQPITEPSSEAPSQPMGQIPDKAAPPAAAAEQVDESVIKQQLPQSENSAQEQTAPLATEASAAEYTAASVDTPAEQPADQNLEQPASTDQPSEPRPQSQVPTETPKEQKQSSPEQHAAAAASSEATPAPAAQPSPPQEQPQMQAQQKQPEPQEPQLPKASTPPAPVSAPAPAPAPAPLAEESQSKSVSGPQQPSTQPNESGV